MKKELITAYLATIGATYGVKLVTQAKVYKTYADLGYICNFDSLASAYQEMNSRIPNIGIPSTIIPGYNIYDAIKESDVALNTNPEWIATLVQLGLLEKMSDEEQENYLNQPNLLTALKLNLKHIALREEAILQKK